MPESNDLRQLAVELRTHITQMLTDIITEPVKYAISQLPIILERQDWTETQKAEAIQHLQLAIVAPLLNAAVNAAQASQMDLGTFLNYAGTSWEHIRAQVLAQVGQEILNRAPGMSGDDNA